MNLIPGIGGSIDVLVSGTGQIIIQQRLWDFIVALQQKMARMQVGTLDRAFLASEEWYDLVRQAFEAAARTRDREKITTYAMLLRGAATAADRSEFSPEELLSILVELYPREVDVLFALYRMQEKQGKQGRGATWAWALDDRGERGALLAQCPSVSDETLPFILLRLQRAGLLYQDRTESLSSYSYSHRGTAVLQQLMTHLVTHAETEQ